MVRFLGVSDRVSRVETVLVDLLRGLHKRLCPRSLSPCRFLLRQFSVHVVILVDQRFIASTPRH